MATAPTVELERDAYEDVVREIIKTADGVTPSDSLALFTKAELYTHAARLLSAERRPTQAP
jgi:hypothetical protein